jgi:TrmH family RNA methyltransferase
MTNPTHPSRELTITSAANPRLKGLLGLRRRRTREETGQTLVEGYEEIGLALSAGVRPGTVYVCEELFSPAGRAGSQDIGHQTDLLARLRDDRVEVVHLSRGAFEKVSYREGPDGLLAVVDRVGVTLDDLRVP